MYGTSRDKRLFGFALRDYFWFFVSHFCLLSESIAFFPSLLISGLFSYLLRTRHPPGGFGIILHIP